MKPAVPPSVVLETADSVLYPGADGVVTRGTLPISRTDVVACQVRFEKGVSANGAVLAVEDNGWLLRVESYTTARGRVVEERSWALEQPYSETGKLFRIRSMFPLGPVGVG